MSAYGSYEAGIEQKQAYDYNANLADIQAKQTQDAGDITQRQLKEEEITLGQDQEAAYAKAGVMLSGSALDVMLKSSSDMQFEQSVERYNTAVKVAQAQSQAAMDRYYGQIAHRQGNIQAGVKSLQAAGTILEGIQSTIAAGAIP